MSNRASQFFGRKSVIRLTEESTSNLNDDDVFQGYTEEHPLVFDFSGPIDPSVHPTLATNREIHLSHRVCLNAGKGEMKLRCCWASVNKLWKAMEEKGDWFTPVRNQILVSPFGSLFRCGYAVADRSLVYALIERWWDTTHTFHFSQGEIGITPLDVTMLTGMSIERGRAVTFGDDRYSKFEYAQRFWPSLTDEHWSKWGIKPTFFVNEFIERTREADDGWCPEGNDREVYVRSFYFYLITQCFFPTGDSSLMLGWVECLEELENIHTYDWGGAMFEALIFALDQACRPKNNVAECQCGGFTPLLQYWWYEYVPSMAPLLKANRNRDIVPRMRAWMGDFRVRQANQGSHNIHLDRNQLEFRSGLAINWTPWFLSRYVTLDVDDVEDAWTREAIDRARRSYILSQCRIVFEYGDMVVWYLGDRCWHQIIGIPFIPHPPPVNMRPVGGASPWRHFLKENEAMWSHGSRYLDMEGDYDNYWDRVSRGPILPPEIYRAGNMDFVGHRGIQTDLCITHPVEPYASSQDPYESFVRPPFDPENEWSYDMITSQGMRVDMPIPHVDRSSIPTLGLNFDSLDVATLRDRYVQSQLMVHGMRDSFMNTTNEYYHHLLTERQRSDEIERQRAELEEQLLQMTLQESRRTRKSRRRQQGEGMSGI